MGLIKEYVDRAVQTDTDTVPSPYADPAVVLAAPPVTRSGPAQQVRIGRQHSALVSSPTGSGGEYASPQSPISPMLAPLVSRRLSRRKHARCSAGETVNRRIVSMPESKSEALYHVHGKRVVSMPDRVRPTLEPSVELYQSPTAAGDSFGSYNDRHERVRVFRAPSDVPQTPSPPSSPESLLIIATGTQLPEGFLRRKYLPEPLIEEDEDWVTWANSPPRPIPALHGPLSLPYARCPSGAEGTIIEEPDNVAQMIWGLGPDDQPQVRMESLSTHSDNPQNVPSHGPSQVPPRLQKKRTSGALQAPKLPRTQGSSHVNHAKHLSRPQHQAYDDKHSASSQVSADIEARQDIVSGRSWNEGQSMATNVGVPGNLVNGTGVFPMDSNRVLEWQLARLRHALRTSLTDMDSYTAFPGRLEPVVPAATPGLPQSYPRIFVEPRPNESITATARQTSIEIAHQYRQQQLYRQALQKQKLQIQNLLPTPPNSSSPEWSPRFSPYLTYCPTFSPELVGSTEHPVPVSSQKYRSGMNTTQYHRHSYDLHEQDHVNNFDTGTDTSWAKIPQIASDAVPLRQTASSASTLAKYIKQLQALSPVANFSSLQSVTPNASLPSLPSADESDVPFHTVYHSPRAVVPTPPSPESPQTIPRGYNSTRLMTCPVQRRLASVPEEDSAILELSTSVTPSRLQGKLTTDSISSTHDGTTGIQTRFVEVSRKHAILDVPEVEGSSGSSSVAFHHGTSPVKVRLPVTKEHNLREQTGGCHEQSQHGHKKKHRYKKLRGSAATNEPTTMRGLVG